MAKKDRTGNRKTRDQRKQFKVPELGYYLIVTDTEATERCFFIYKCTKLSKITIPSKVAKIGKQTFSGYKALKCITIKTTKLKNSKVVLIVMLFNVLHPLKACFPIFVTLDGMIILLSFVHL